MLSLVRLAPLQFVCVTAVVVLLLHNVAKRVLVTDQHRQLSSLRDKLIQQRDDVAKSLNNLQVNVYTCSSLS